MALQSSGAISLNDINIEFARGSGTTISLNQLYRGGGIVGPNNTNVPTSGAISLSNFYGATRRTTASYTYNSSVANAVLNSSNVPGYVAGVTDLTVYIPSGVALYANIATEPGFKIGAFSTGDTIRIENSGTIAGKGGNGGGLGGFANGNMASPAALDLSPTNASVTVINSATGKIHGGGGGGGAGRSISVGYPYGYGYAYTRVAGGGGGGGGGYSGGTAGAVLGVSDGPGPSNYYSSGGAGSAGASDDTNTTAGGAGGSGAYGHWNSVSPNFYVRGGGGGAGGAKGAAGTDGYNAEFSGQDWGITGAAAAGVTQTIPYTGTPVLIGTQYNAGTGYPGGNAIKGTGKLASPVSNSGSILGPQVA